MDWLGDGESVNEDGKGEVAVPALSPIGAADKEVENEDDDQNAGGTEESESGDLIGKDFATAVSVPADQQSVVQMEASMNVSNQLSQLINSLPVANKFSSEGCDDLNRKPSSPKKAKVGPPPKTKKTVPTESG